MPKMIGARETGPPALETKFFTDPLLKYQA
jgi:hypothetical protein